MPVLITCLIRSSSVWYSSSLSDKETKLSFLLPNPFILESSIFKAYIKFLLLLTFRLETKGKIWMIIRK